MRGSTALIFDQPHGHSDRRATDGSGRIAYIFADRIGQAALQYVAKLPGPV
jgi:hypothetical protein